MGGLSHYLEREGLATTQISLIREHSEKIKPPRALWVPFELGRPLGVPNDPAFQKRVLLAALNLLEAPSGPVLVDFPEEAPVSTTQAGPLACPISLPRKQTDLDSREGLRQAFLQEVIQMAVWHREAEKKRGRTTYGASGLDPQEAARLLAGFLVGELPANPMNNLSLASLVKLASEDIKALYMEAITTLPGGLTDSASLTDWFFGQCVAGQVFLRLREVMSQSPDKETRLVGSRLLIPVSQASRKVFA
ncbi:MAG: hypothetical protein KMY53_01470 [Desulfarculus sp.]|nr:hypothetical protein [Pseudomonadota bacterium]MBV1716541.1 hypothetical protein [Desulfarculus sp.]MCG2766048.1 hypothetical protein [Desulfarculaceae bacterium]MBU4382386.1 hypothetical protein [Pseudomonadota bacterium]MBU4566770.1 hypothetical protein [Pseudomonadota bacterium]